MTSHPLLWWVIGVFGGAAVATTAWLATRDVFSQPLFARRNYRGAQVPVGAGVIIALAAITVTGFAGFVDSVTESTGGHRASMIVLAVCVGFSLLGFIDDLAGSGDDRGFRGHVKAMFEGRLTTGGLKLIGGGFLSIGAAALAVPDDWWRVLIGALVISLAANLANLFDRAPGRTAKVGIVLAVPLLALCGAGERYAMFGVVTVIGAVVGLIYFDLREELMLGDAGSNVIGAALGLGLVVTTSTATQVVVLFVLVAFNAISEKVSFSRVIDSVAPLRALDRLGRRRAD